MLEAALDKYCRIYDVLFHKSQHTPDVAAVLLDKNVDLVATNLF